MSKLLIILPGLFTVLAGLAGPLAADQLTIEFEDMSWVSCGDTWEVGGLQLMMWDSPDCQSLATPYGWGVAGTCIEFDLTPLPNLSYIAVHIRNYHDPGETWARLLDEVVPLVTVPCITSMWEEIIKVDARGLPATRLRVQGGYFLFYSVTFTYGRVPIESASWGEIKELYE